LGSDTLGSIRIPAAYCGVTGLKPTHGAVSLEGMVCLVERLDCIGPIARSVADCAAVMAVLADLRQADPIVRIATLSNPASVELEPAVASAVRLGVSLLGGLGLDVREHPSAIDHQRLRIAGFIEAAREADALFGAEAATAPDGFSPQFRSYLEFGRGIDPASVAQGRRTLDAAAAELSALLLMVDAVLLPTTPQAAFAHAGPVPVTQADFTALANFAGVPALAIPAGWTADGLPVGVQLIGRRGQEAALLALGSRLEAALNAYLPPPDPA
ncbi:MAG: amidase family protein, partial [Sandaracinobacteroides sp.]